MRQKSPKNATFSSFSREIVMKQRKTTPEFYSKIQAWFQ